MKYHLRRVVNDRHLSIEEFSTLLCQVEAALNSRPLTQMSIDPNDFEALTPGHFLIQRGFTALPQENLTEVKPNYLSRWQLIQQMAQHHFRRWSSEYLQQLQPKIKWRNSQDNIQVGALVLIHDAESQLGPLKWKLGRIVTTHPGIDGKVRVCDIRYRVPPTAKNPEKFKVTRRAITKISQLPISE
jgi:hypothetical protein